MPRAAAVFNLQRAMLLVDALHSSDLGMLRLATEDALHQVRKREGENAPRARARNPALFLSTFLSLADAHAAARRTSRRARARRTRTSSR